MTTCVFCLATTEMVRVTPDGAASMPPRWATVTVHQSGKMVRNSVVCPECITYIPALLR